MADRDRRGAEKRGRTAETIAVVWLRLKGYSILAQRFKRASGEIDIIAKRGQILAFIEVKQRSNVALAQTAVTERSWQRIARTAELWAATRPNLRTLDWRFDLIAVSASNTPKHFRDYWRP